MVNSLEQSRKLKQALHTFVLDAEGDLATALEQYSVDRLQHWSATKLQGISRSDLAVDMFTTEGQVNHQSVLTLFAQQPDLSAADQAMVESWQATFNGLFEVIQKADDGFELMNWLTEKRYPVQPNGAQREETISRLAPGEIVLARLSPIAPDIWTFSGPMLLLGKLGKPKLAVAVGNFKDWFPDSLYGNAPELLEAAWESVERYHDDFVSFFGGEQITLSGYELNKKLKDYQEFMTQRQLEAAGIDSSKSLKDLADQAGVSEQEIAESVEAMGEDGRQVSRLLKNPQSMKMVMPPVSLPDELRKAEAVTVFVHPRWGQTLLKDYRRLTQLLAATDEEAATKLDRQVQRYLKDDAVNPYVWHRLAEDHPDLEVPLRRVLDRPDFSLQNDLDKVLLEAGKPLKPKLPEIASVPVHLNDLFQTALQEVNQGSSKKSKKKGSGKAKPKSGFAS
ncbi:hypothetical protein C7271_08500 [filamentous cyanobacterium CCP5]|nr:hypothetical protein C7271_08500 [filamentous cyanobacterium CCP5]